MKTMIKFFFKAFGFEIKKSPKNIQLETFFSNDASGGAVLEKEYLHNFSQRIPGMISPQAGGELFSLCYMQSEKGDVVEIGSWQGKSTFYLGTAVKYSGNGSMIAIDHFNGNKGKEHLYRVNKDDLSDLRETFTDNMTRMGLTEIKLFDMKSARARAKLNKHRIRFLFIDGDHSYEGVKGDIELFKDLLVPGALVVFDDYSKRGFPGVVKAVGEFCEGNERVSRTYKLGRTFIIKLR